MSPLAASTLLADDRALAQETRKLWRRYDTKGHALGGADGLIDEGEALALVQTFCDDVGLPMPRKDRFQKLYALTDKNNSGKLSFDEFTVFFKRLLQTATNKLEAKKLEEEAAPPVRPAGYAVDPISVEAHLYERKFDGKLGVGYCGFTASLRPPNVGKGIAIDGELGVDVLRVENENMNVGIGARADTGLVISQKQWKLNVLGFGAALDMTTDEATGKLSGVNGIKWSFVLGRVGFKW